MTERTSPLFVVEDETWYVLDGSGPAMVHPTIRPYRRRSWTREAMLAALDHIKAHPERDFHMSGSNSIEMLKLLRCRLPGREKS